MNLKPLLKYIPAAVISFSIVYAGLILYFILKYGVDVPYNDQWEYVGFFDHLAKGTLTFNELFRLQGDYRQFFPNLIFVGLGSLTGWNVKYEMLVIFLMACLVSYNIYCLAAFTITGGKWQKWIVFFFANLFIFSPFQYENWLFGVQIEYFIPILCITTGLVVALSRMDALWKLIICMLLSVVSTFSSVNGLICWIVLFPVFFVTNVDRKFFAKWQVISAWLLGTILTIEVYFAGYTTPINHPSPFMVFSNPGEAIQYFFGVLGNPLRIIHSLDIVIIVGGVLFAIYVLMVAYIALQYKDKQLMRDSIAWVMLGVYSIGTTAFVTAGRLGFGLEQSLTPRYTSYTLYLIVSILFLAALIIQRFAEKGRFRNIYKIALAVFLVLFLYNRYEKYSDSYVDLKAFHAAIQHGKAGLMLINYIPHQECDNKIYPFEFKKLKKRARTLDSLGLLRPPLVKSDLMQDMEGEGSGQKDYGMFKKLVRLDDTSFVAYGEASYPGTKWPVDAVVLSYDEGLNRSVMFNISNKDSVRWKKVFSVKNIPSDTILVKAWAFDANTAKAYRLSGDYFIRK